MDETNYGFELLNLATRSGFNLYLLSHLGESFSLHHQPSRKDSDFHRELPLRVPMQLSPRIQKTLYEMVRQSEIQKVFTWHDLRTNTTRLSPVIIRGCFLCLKYQCIFDAKKRNDIEFSSVQWCQGNYRNEGPIRRGMWEA